MENNSAYDLYTYLSEMKCICIYKEYYCLLNIEEDYQISNPNQW